MWRALCPVSYTPLDVYKRQVSDNGRGLPEEGRGRKDSLELKLVHIMTRQIKGKLVSENKGGARFSLLFELEVKR